MRQQRKPPRATLIMGTLHASVTHFAFSEAFTAFFEDCPNNHQSTWIIVAPGEGSDVRFHRLGEMQNGDYRPHEHPSPHVRGITQVMSSDPGGRTFPSFGATAALAAPMDPASRAHVGADVAIRKYVIIELFWYQSQYMADGGAISLTVFFGGFHQ